MNYPADTVLVVVPPNNECCVVIDASGHPHYAEVDADGCRKVWLPAETARAMLNGGLPHCIAWREANMSLSASLGPVPKLQPGINLARYQSALEVLRPTHPRDVRATLREIGGRLR